MLLFSGGSRRRSTDERDWVVMVGLVYDSIYECGGREGGLGEIAGGQDISTIMQDLMK